MSVFTAYYLFVAFVWTSWILGVLRPGPFRDLWRGLSWKAKAQAYIVTGLLIMTPVSIAKQYVAAHLNHTVYIQNPVEDWVDENITEPLEDRVEDWCDSSDTITVMHELVCYN